MLNHGYDGKDFFYEEAFDDYVAIVNGYVKNARLTIFKYVKGYKAPWIVYQADASGVRCTKKLKNQIGEFRYAFTQNEYDNLDNSATK